MSQPNRTGAIDAAIISAVRPRWLKVARIVSDAERALEGQAPPIDSALGDQQQAAARDALLDAIAQRIQALVEAGKLESVGNLSNWRYSEVRLPPNAK